MRFLFTLLFIAACHCSIFSQAFYTWEYDDAQPDPTTNATHYGIDRIPGNGYLTFGSYSTPAVNGNFPFLTRLDDQGNPLWVRNYDYFAMAPFTPGPGGSIFNNQLLTRDGGFILELLSNSPWLVKCNSAGDTLWTKRPPSGVYLGMPCMDELSSGDLLFNIGTNQASPNITVPELVWADSAYNPYDTIAFPAMAISYLSSVDVAGDDGIYLVGLDSNFNYTAARIDSNGAFQWDTQFYLHTLQNPAQPRGAMVAPNQSLVTCTERRRSNSWPNNSRKAWEIHNISPTGTVNWQVTVPDDFGTPPTWFAASAYWTVREDGMVLVTVNDSTESRIYAIDPNGNTAWDRILPDPPGYVSQMVRGMCSGVENTKAIVTCGRHFAGNSIVPFAAGYDSLANFQYALLQGTVYHDSVANCVQNAGEAGLPSALLLDENGNIKAITDSAGNYEFVMGVGSQTYTAHPIANNWVQMWDINCPSTDSLTAVYSGVPPVDTLPGGDFAMEQLMDCPLMTVDVSAPFVRYCSLANYYVNYCNAGTDSAYNAYIVLSIDSAFTTFTPTVPFTTLGPDSYQINLGDLAPGECGSFQFTAMDPCQMPFQPLTRCVEAHIYPDSSCLPPPANWSGAEVRVEGWCAGEDTVWFRVSNVGTSAMQSTSGVWVVEDDILRQTQQVQLNAGEDSTFFVLANGATWTTMADQVPNFPWPSIPRASVEACGLNGNGGVSTGFVTSFEDDDRMPWRSIDCQQIIAAIDPNDKTGYPTGVGPVHKIFANTEMEYRIRFQNTGTDTAFTVTIQDSLPSELDLSTFISGVSSHDYSVSILPGNVVQWTFNQIMLPDSGVNEPASHGFVKFRIMQDADLPNGSRIENSAGIIFDFMPPVITNTAFHTIGELELVVTVEEQMESAVAPIRVYPNPAVDHATFDLGTHYKSVRLEVYDLQGRLLRQVEGGNTDSICLEREGLAEGMYLFRVSAQGRVIGSGRLLVRAR